MATAVKKQDMPPSGGYRSIPYVRNPAKSYFSGVGLIAGFVAITSYGLFEYYRASKQIRRNRVERRSAYLALTPLLTAEKDREKLKQLRRNRDEEAKLMADVPGWEVGTYYGEKVYKSLPEDAWVEPHSREFYAHASERDYRRRLFFKNWI
ncbi:NADH dehydrogenase [ubiquinone] 1 alpha subcomplex subunit 13 [Cloeon dipterum]|uniref:NADH dehydrogenase [ubiquinone] 1 alpha subcomplex subunit 13 n=1 Tax=Cloeon dipterum TaxID=197152 RepID=UPI003220753A